MANKKQFFRDVNPGDVSIEGRQSNGITARADGSVILYSGVKNNELENLQNYNGNIPIDGYLGNIIAVLKADQEVAFPIGNNNEETYIESTQIDPNKIITAENTTTDCGNEFDEAATVLLNWENDNVSLGWDPYGANGTGIKNGEIDKAKKYFLDNYWNTNDKNTGDYSIAEAASTLTSPDEPKLLIKNLPPGLRIMAAQFNYNAKQWWTRILAAVGEDWLNSIYGLPYRVTVNLPKTGGPFVYEYFLKDGVTKSGNKVYSPYAPIPFNAGKDQTVQEGWKRVWMFLREYDDIISLYNKDKVKFLTALKDETIRYYKTLDNSNNRQDLLNFHVTYVEKAYELALKYKDCPPQQTQQTQQVQQVQQAQQQTASNTLLTKEKVPPPALEYLPEDEFFDQTPVQIFNEVDYYRNVEVIDGSLWIATAGYSAQVQALYNSEKSGVSTKTKSGKEVIIAAKAMIDKAIARYPMIADKSKYPDAMNRLLALLLVAYNETRFTPQNENPNHTYNTAKRAKLRKVYSLTLDQFYNKFGVKAGQESKRASGDAQTADPPAIFKYAYADYNGNGDEASGDGYKFRGRGYYGITFKNGYKEIGKVMYGDENKFITDPDSINVEPDATNAFLTSMFEGGLCALKVGLLAYTTTPAKVNGFNIGALVDVTLPNGTKKKIRGDLASNYTTFRGANNLVNGYTAQGYVDNFSNIFNSQELRDYINSKLK